MRRRGHGSATLLAAIVGVLVGAGLVWMVLSRQVERQPAGGGAATAPLRPAATSSEEAIVKAVSEVGPAVVNISTLIRPSESRSERLLRQFMGLPQPFPREGEGSGIVIDGQKGYVLTNAHVVRAASEVRVTLSDKRIFEARVVGSDPLSDIAVVRISGSNLPVARLGSAAKLPIGAWVIAIGNPFGLQNSVTVGVVSAKGRQIPAPGGIFLQDLIQTDASINPGNSGGALVDLNGQVIGIPTAMIPQAQGMGFAVSIDSARQVFEKLIKTGKMPWLGIMHHYLSPDEAKKLNLPGAKGTLVVRVVTGSPADQAGIMPGDVIVLVANREMDDEQTLGEIIRARNVGDRVDVTVWRNGKRVALRVTLGAVPQQGLEPDQSLR